MLLITKLHTHKYKKKNDPNYKYEQLRYCCSYALTNDMRRA